MYRFFVSAGLLSAEHQKRMGRTMWVFLWLIDHETRDAGKVLNGNSITIKQIAEDLGLSERTTRRHLNRLVCQGYITRERGPDHQANHYTVCNSKKWARAPAKNGKSTGQNCPGHRPVMTGAQAKIGPSNKEDRQLDIIDNKPPYPPLPEVSNQWRSDGASQPQRVSAVVARWHNNNAEFERAERAHESVMALARSLKANGGR